MRSISEERKRREGRGQGCGADYKPWIKIREIRSVGTAANVVDWKHGRTTQLLSQGEEWYYYVLRWDDNVTDIREQYPLFEPEDTVRIADFFGLKHPKDRKTTMTTDMLVDYADGHQEAISIKSSRKDVDYRLARTEDERKTAIRTAEKLLIEKKYWVEKGIKWRLLYKEDLNPLYVNNIRRSVVYYDLNKVHDDISMIRHLIATKQIIVDLFKPIDYRGLVAEYLKEG